MSKIFDITLSISPNLPVWPGDPPIRISQPYHLERGDSYSLTRLEMSAHTGTHVDAPAHFIPGGHGVESLDLTKLIGPALVTAVPNQWPAIDAHFLNGCHIPAGTTRLLFKSRNSNFWSRSETTFNNEYVAVTLDGAKWLVENGIKLVGVDYLSVAPFAEAEPVHRYLLAANVHIVEGLDLHAVSPGNYQLVCLPLKLAGADGAPARAVLMENDVPSESRFYHTGSNRP